MIQTHLVELYRTVTAYKLQIIIGATQFLILNEKIVQIICFPGIKTECQRTIIPVPLLLPFQTDFSLHVLRLGIHFNVLENKSTAGKMENI